jgi:hypothetical protein
MNMRFNIVSFPYKTKSGWKVSYTDQKGGKLIYTAKTYKACFNFLGFMDRGAI